MQDLTTTEQTIQRDAENALEFNRATWTALNVRENERADQNKQFPDLASLASYLDSRGIIDFRVSVEVTVLVEPE